MTNDQETMSEETGLPTVVRDLLGFLASGSTAAPEDARRAWRDLGVTPSTAEVVVESMVTGGVITAAQGDLMREAFARAQVERLVAMIDAARARGLLSPDVCASARSEYAGVALVESPGGYLIAKGLLTPAQAEGLQEAKPFDHAGPSPVGVASSGSSASRASTTAPSRTFSLTVVAAVAVVALIVGAVGGHFAKARRSDWGPIEAPRTLMARPGVVPPPAVDNIDTTTARPTWLVGTWRCLPGNDSGETRVYAFSAQGISLYQSTMELWGVPWNNPNVLALLPVPDRGAAPASLYLMELNSDQELQLRLLGPEGPSEDVWTCNHFSGAVDANTHESALRSEE